MAAAVTHLTPVTLELGGKCPAIVDSLSATLDLKVAFFIPCNHKMLAITKLAELDILQ